MKKPFLKSLRTLRTQNALTGEITIIALFWDDINVTPTKATVIGKARPNA